LVEKNKKCGSIQENLPIFGYFLKKLDFLPHGFCGDASLKQLSDFVQRLVRSGIPLAHAIPGMCSRILLARSSVCKKTQTQFEFREKVVHHRRFCETPSLAQ